MTKKLKKVVFFSRSVDLRKLRKKLVFYIANKP